MFKLAGAVVDCYDDPTFMSSIAAQSMLGHELLDPSELHKLADRDFAIKIVDGNITARKLPIYNETITKISCAYLYDMADKLPQEVVKTAAARLASACEKFGIGIPSEFEPIERTGRYTVVLEQEQTPAAIRDEEELGKFAAWEAAKQFPRMTPEDKVILADELNKVGAAQYQPEVMEYVPSNTYGPLLKQAINDRKYILRGDESDNTILINALEDMYERRNEKSPLQFAIELATFDKVAGLRPRYKNGLTDPYKASFKKDKGSNPVEHGQAKNEHEAQAPTPVNVEVGSGLAKDAAEKMTVAEHLEAIAKHYGHVKNAAKADDTYGATFKTAWNLYFRK